MQANTATPKTKRKLRFKLVSDYQVVYVLDTTRRHGQHGHFNRSAFSVAHGEIRPAVSKMLKELVRLANDCPKKFKDFDNAPKKPYWQENGLDLHWNRSKLRMAMWSCYHGACFLARANYQYLQENPGV